MQIVGGMFLDGQPVTVDMIHQFVGTPSVKQLTVASVDESLQFVRYAY